MPIFFNKNKQVFDEAGISYTVENLAFMNSNGTKIYKLQNYIDKVYVEAPDIHEHRAVISKMSNVITDQAQFSSNSIFQKMFWPEKLVKGENDDGFTGFIANSLPVQGNMISLADVIEERRKKTTLTDAEREFYYNLGIQLAEIIEMVHQCGYVVGTLAPDKFWVSKEGVLSSCVTYQFSFENVYGFDNPHYVTPEWLSSGNRKYLVYNQESDSFLYAIILFQLLTGKYPFSTDRNIAEVTKEEIWEQMVDGKSLYFWEDSIIIEMIKKELHGLPSEVDTLFTRTFDYCGYASYEEPRASISEWLSALRKKVFVDFGATGES